MEKKRLPPLAETARLRSEDPGGGNCCAAEQLSVTVRAPLERSSYHSSLCWFTFTLYLPYNAHIKQLYFCHLSGCNSCS